MLKMSLSLNNTQRGVTQRGEKKKCIGGGAERDSKCGGKVTERERTGKMERRRQKKKKHSLPLSCGARCEKQKCCCGSIQANSREAFITDNCRRLLTCACACVIKDVCVYSLNVPLSGRCFLTADSPSVSTPFLSLFLFSSNILDFSSVQICFSSAFFPLPNSLPSLFLLHHLFPPFLLSTPTFP